MSGAPRLLTLTTPTVRNQKTLIWLQNQAARDWSKWDAVVTRLSDYHRWYDENARIVGLALLSVEGDQEEFLADMYQTAADCTLVVLSDAILRLKPAEYWSDNFDNVVRLEDIHETYPLLGSPWDGSEADAVALFAHLCRYHRVVDADIERSNYPLIVAKGIVPQECWLVTQFFRHTDAARHAEILECLRRNVAEPLIGRIILLNETDGSEEWKEWGAEKITQVVIQKRLTYAHFLQFVHDEVPPNVFVILANADMYFGSSLSNVWSVNMEDRMMALLRWDVKNGEEEIFGPRADSQDSWIILSNSVQSKSWPYATFDFPLGKPGCDNAFAAHMLRQRFVLCNPSLTLKTYHLHVSGIRNYNKRDIIRSDVYINLVPTYLIDTKQEAVPAGPHTCLCNELVSFDVHSSSLSNEITYCTMLEKDGRYKWGASIENTYFEPAIPVYRWKNAGVTPNGLVYEPYTIYTGKQPDTYPYWRGSTVDLFTPFEKREKMVAIPLPDTRLFRHPDTYLLYYLARALRIIKEHSGASFWLPSLWETHARPWTAGKSAVLFDEHISVWADEVVGCVPGPFELGREDIQVLRAGLPSWSPSPIRRKAVFVMDSVITSSFLQDWMIPWFRRQDASWDIQMISETDSYDSVVGSSLCVVGSGACTSTRWAKLWALPVGCKVVEFQQELDIDGECQHLCHVADVASWILLLAKGSNADVQQQVLTHLMKWYKTHMN